jgi:hypothetical protein
MAESCITPALVANDVGHVQRTAAAAAALAIAAVQTVLQVLLC